MNLKKSNPDILEMLGFAVLSLLSLILLTGAEVRDNSTTPEEQQVLADFIMAIASGEKPNAATVLMTAKLTNLNPEILAKLTNKGDY